MWIGITQVLCKLLTLNLLQVYMLLTLNLF
jgi:hypothetical protein